MALLLRLETTDGMVKWRPFRSHDDATNHDLLCRSFGLDPIRTSFDLPSTARGVGSDRGDHRRGGRLINGFVKFAGQDEPIGVLTFATSAEQFRDADPTDLRDLFALRNTVR